MTSCCDAKVDVCHRRYEIIELLLLCNDRQWWSRACPRMTALTARGMTATVTNVVRVARVRTHNLVTRTTDCARLAVMTGSTHPTSAGDTSKVGFC